MPLSSEEGGCYAVQQPPSFMGFVMLARQRATSVLVLSVLGGGGSALQRPRGSVVGRPWGVAYSTRRLAVWHALRRYDPFTLDLLAHTAMGVPSTSTAPSPIPVLLY